MTFNDPVTFRGHKLFHVSILLELFMIVFFSLITKYFASQFGFRTFVRFPFSGFGRSPCMVRLQVQFELYSEL